MNCIYDYEIRFINKAGQVLDGPKNVEVLHYQRKLNNSSVADLDLIIGGDACCSELNKIEPIAHMMEIRRNGIQVWFGWVLDTEEGRKTFHFDAFDAIGWLKRRKIHSDMSWANEDLTNVFLDLWNDAMAPDPIKARVVSSQSGTRETRSVRQLENRLTWSPVKEMLDSGLDITTFGQTVLAGVIHSTKQIELKLSDFEGDVRLAKLGSQYGNYISVDASESIQAHYPDALPKPNEFYPLVEVVVKDTQIENVENALNRAKSQYEYSRRVPRILTNTDSLVLQPNVDIDINDLIPGIRVIVDTEGLCTEIKQEFKLAQVDVNVSSGAERITIALQPTGPRAGLDSALEPIF